MNKNLSSSSSQLDRAMTGEQFEQVVDAILSGKYSWACVLILRFGGYNPLHYIPYRTYNRLMKQAKNNCQSTMGQAAKTPESKSTGSLSQRSSLTQLGDLNYLEEIQHHSDKVTGGNNWGWLEHIFV